MTIHPVPNVADGPLLGTDHRRLPSAHFGDFLPVFQGEWHSDHPRPRFGDDVWEVIGLERSPRRETWPISFEDLTPEWSRIAREALFLTINRREYRHIYSYTGSDNHKSMRGATIVRYRAGIGVLAQFADLTGAGLPHRWEQVHVEDFQDLALSGNYGAPLDVARGLRLLRSAAGALTSGGPRFDPLMGQSTLVWAGETESRGALASVGLAPEVFRQIVCNALFYTETAADDILAAQRWWDRREQFAQPKKPRVVFTPARYPNHPDDVGEERSRRLHDAIETLGGIPTPTVSTNGYLDAQPGEPDRNTLFAIAGVARKSRAEGIATRIINNRLASGTPLVPGGIPVPVSSVALPDGTHGPWRDPFCARAIEHEIQTLANAALIVIAAFTAMRESEISNIPRHAWRTTWHGQDALVSALVKTANAEPRKWWATPPVIRACEVLDQIVHPSSPFLTMVGETARAGGEAQRNTDKSWTAIQSFVKRINRDGSLRGFLPIDAGFKRTGGVNAETDDTLPSIHTRSFRFTLASISNFVALGDVAFQQQAKHAQVLMTHSYMANSTTPEWHDVLNGLFTVEGVGRAGASVPR